MRKFLPRVVRNAERDGAIPVNLRPTWITDQTRIRFKRITGELTAAPVTDGDERGTRLTRTGTVTVSDKGRSAGNPPLIGSS
jgi:hypothetical protein